MFKANSHIYTKHGVSKYDHARVRRKTHQNQLNGWKHDGWAFSFWLSIYKVRGILCGIYFYGNSQWQLWVEIFARLFSKVWQVI